MQIIIKGSPKEIAALERELKNGTQVFNMQTKSDTRKSFDLAAQKAMELFSQCQAHGVY